MKKKIDFDWAKLRRRSLWIGLVVLFLVTVGFSRSRMQSMPCTGLVATILDSSGDAFLSESDIQQLVDDRVGDLQTKSMASINTAMLEKIMLANPFVASARVFSTLDGRLHVEVRQRVPVVRVINTWGESFYIDENGVYMPVSDHYTARVPVSNGYIFNREAEGYLRTYDDEKLSDTSLVLARSYQVFKLATFIRQDPFWNAQIEQIFVNLNGDLELVPRVGDHTIVFGDISRMEEKFEKLYLFYQEGLNNTGWNRYSTINLKYNNQVVCTKK